jgi:type I restriction enzyme, R subunit
VQQAKDYGIRLGLPLVYATNGRKIIELDLYAGTQNEVDHHRSADELWDYYRSTQELDALGVRFFEVPYSRELVVAGTGEIKQTRYYQHRAAQAALHATAAGQQRILAVLATGTGKSMLAAQLVHVLWQSYWPRGAHVPDPRPRVLYLADRDVLIKDPLLKYFSLPVVTSD